MGRRISSFSIELLLLLLLSVPLQAQGRMERGGENPPRKEKKGEEPEIVYPLFNGIEIGIDLWGIGNKVFGGHGISSEVAVDVNLKQRYFPIVELGYRSSDEWSDNGIHYKSNAPYFRIGMDYNALYKKKHGHMMLVGLRYGFSSFKYDIHSLGMDDPVYGGEWNPNIVDDVWGSSLPFHHQGMKCNMQWAEFCVGVRAHIHKALYMGWALRFKFKVSASPDQYGDPWQVPGYGKYGNNVMGVSYTVTYKLPSRK